MGLPGRHLRILLVACCIAAAGACGETREDKPIDGPAQVQAGGNAVLAAAPNDIAAETPEAATSASPLPGSRWQLVEIASMDDSVYRPTDRSAYTLGFGTDGTAQLRADCNQGMGSWTSTGPGQLTFGDIATTRAMCPPESLHDRYLAQFPWVQSYMMKDGHLFLATMADGSIIEFEPIPADDPAATVLGQDIRTSDPAELQEAILSPLFDQYAAAKGLAAEPAEIDAFVAALENRKTQDLAERKARLADIEQRLQAPDLGDAEKSSLQTERESTADLLAALQAGTELTPEETEQVQGMQRSMAGSIIRQWKLNRELYREYGGRIIYQQLGPEPLDAMRRFLEQRQQEGAFTIHVPALETAFWTYFRDDAKHDFYEAGSKEEAQAFSTPPWESLR